jgi:hypothetical protein
MIGVIIINDEIVSLSFSVNHPVRLSLPVSWPYYCNHNQDPNDFHLRLLSKSHRTKFTLAQLLSQQGDYVKAKDMMTLAREYSNNSLSSNPPLSMIV